MSSENLTTNQPELIPSVETPVSETKTTDQNIDIIKPSRFVYYLKQFS